jgi:hydrogenase nickel incorporation protein HypB
VRWIDVKRAVYEENDALAARIHEGLRSRGIFTVNFIRTGARGAVEGLAAGEGLAAAEGLAVIEGDVASDIDTRALLALGIDAYQIETGGDCHLNAAMIEAILGRMEIRDASWLFIENIGNLVCPAEFVLGEDIKIVVASVAEGSDKPYKYPAIFAASAACVLTKIDLREAMAFDEASFRSGLGSASPSAPLFPVNGRSGEGVDELLVWLRGARQESK